MTVPSARVERDVNRAVTRMEHRLAPQARLRTGRQAQGVEIGSVTQRDLRFEQERVSWS
jgi:hypothetical protein